MARNFTWFLVGFLGSLALMALIIALVTLPDGSRSLTARTRGGWWVDLSYTPGRPDIRISLHMEGLSDHRTVAFKVTSSEPWAPTWEATMEGRVSEFVSLADHATAPEPMTPVLAERVARSYSVTLVADGQTQAIDFADAQVTEPLVLPTVDVLRFWFGRIRNQQQFGG